MVGDSCSTSLGQLTCLVRVPSFLAKQRCGHGNAMGHMNIVPKFASKISVAAMIAMIAKFHMETKRNLMHCGTISS